uniref:Uncharacterized protein n=1 Tax=Sander lucioperca TaxID=283035 RepID=A0A8C9YFS4_SANLU
MDQECLWEYQIVMTFLYHLVKRVEQLTLLKHDMALDYILAKQGGLCVALNLTGDDCYTLIPDSTDNITSVIDALKSIRDIQTWTI